MSTSKTEEITTYDTKMGRILIVDDERDIVSTFKKILASEGYAAEGFSDPVEALQNFQPGSFDMAILDIKMPKMTGFELCREIRKRDPKVKIYFMTAFEVNKSEFEKVLPSIHVEGFMKKPLTMSELRSLVSTELAKT